MSGATEFTPLHAVMTRTGTTIFENYERNGGSYSSNLFYSYFLRAGKCDLLVLGLSYFK